MIQTTENDFGEKALPLFHIIVNQLLGLFLPILQYNSKQYEHLEKARHFLDRELTLLIINYNMRC